MADALVIWGGDQGLLYKDHCGSGKSVPYCTVQEPAWYVRGPGITPGSTFDTRLLATPDLFATILAYLGVADPLVPRDAVDIFAASPPPRESIVIEGPSYTGIRHLGAYGDRTYADMGAASGTPRYFLTNLAADPEEAINEPDHADRAPLDALMRALLAG
jgi:hypothetical protein